MNDLLGFDDDEAGPSFSINKDYASRYDRWRQKEVQQKLKDKYGDVDAVEDSDSSSSDEDENPDTDESEEKEFFKTLSCLMSRDPKIYDDNVKFFQKMDKKSGEKTNQKQPKKEKPLYLKDYERKLIVEKEGVLTDEEDSETDVKHKRSVSPTYVEEQKQLKDSFKFALNDDDEDGFLSEKTKTKEELEKEEADYLTWLKGNEAKIDDHEQKEMKHLRDYWNDPKLNRDEVFLRDYILNKRYLDEHDKKRVPAYDEIVHESEDSTEDEETLEKAAEFEHKFNFRFEEPDPEFIKRYPRTMKDSLRRKDDARKRKREDTKKRKLQERERKQEELKQLKALKRAEILDKLEKLKEITGNTMVGFSDGDIEGDFDPDAHDRKMKQIFDNDYYDVDEDGKPVFPEDDDGEYDAEDWDNWTRDQQNGHNVEEELHCEDTDFNMDADYDPNDKWQQELIEASKGKKKSRKSHFAQVVTNKKPLFNPDDKTFDDYLDEYYKLDYEDLIGDMPCRFKYRKVVSNDFGLSTEEILKADDKELNKWCSLKKASQYRTKQEEMYDVQAYNKKAMHMEKKKKILPSVYAEPPATTSTEMENVQDERLPAMDEKHSEIGDDEVKNVKTNSVKRKRKDVEQVTEQESETVDPEETQTSKKRKKKKKRSLNAAEQVETKQDDVNEGRPNEKRQKKRRKMQKKETNVVSDDRLRAYGLNPKKFKKRSKPRKH